MQSPTFERFVAFVREKYEERSWNASKEVANAFDLRKTCSSVSSSTSTISSNDFISPFDECVVLFANTVRALRTKRYFEAFSFQIKSAELFYATVVQTCREENWFLPIVYQLCFNVWKTAVQADERSYTFSEKEKHKCLRLAGSCIVSYYRDFAADTYTRPEVSKRIGILKLTNILLRIYYELEQWDVMRPLVKAIDDSLDLWNSFSLSDKVCYNYITGSRSGCNFTLKQCSERLTIAFDSCPSRYKKNRHAILARLIPVNVLMGRIPRTKLLRDFDFTIYEPLLAAVKVGDVATLEDLINTKAPDFLENNSWLFVLKLRRLCYRNLFKIMCTVFNDNQVPLEYFVSAFQLLKMDNMDMPAVECVLAGMIYTGQIRGYISHVFQRLTLSQEDPFPPISYTRWIF